MDARAGTPRERILRAAMGLLAEGGRDAVSTRAVSAAAGVQPPTIYRQFGDMRGLLDALVAHGFARYMDHKQSQEPADDPVEDLRRGWDIHVGFGLDHPAIYRLIHGEERPDPMPPALQAGIAMLHRRVERVAAAGRLRVAPDLAASMFHAGGIGVTLALLELPPGRRDPELSPRTREAILAAITLPGPGDAATCPGDEIAAHAIALRALLARDPASLTAGERAVMGEWLDRIAALASRDAEPVPDPVPTAPVPV
jgi:AcrR family transcriptional regulator